MKKEGRMAKTQPTPTITLCNVNEKGKEFEGSN